VTKNTPSQPSTTAPERAAAAAGRWQEPEILDRAAFASAHPETVVTPELWERLEPEIRRRASLLDFDSSAHVQADLQAELRLRIIEAATAFRRTDADGEPVFDYLEQHPRYVVWHAAGRVYSTLRRDRRGTKVTDSIESLGGEDEWGEPTPAEVLDPATLASPTDALEHGELLAGIRERLFPAQQRVLEMLDEGLDRGEIGERLGISRQTVHGHLQAIREAALEMLADDDQGLAMIADRRASRRPSRRAVLPPRPATRTTARSAARSPRAAQPRTGSARPARTR
jgi:RNA polymerase sigma factor (sigma-70 family)